MNHRRALLASTDTGLVIFLIMIAGVVLWTTDEILDWNLLPNWIDKYAQLLVIILSILTAVSVVISVMCSFSVIAESAAEKAGIMAPAPSRRTRWLIASGVIAAFIVMFGLHKVDQYRAGKQRERDRLETRAAYERIKTGLHGRLPSIVSLFSPEMLEVLSSEPTEQGDKSIAQLLNAIKVSTSFDPSVSVIVTARSPYSHCVITASPNPERQSLDNGLNYLQRKYLTGFPTTWELDAINACFEGSNADVARGKSGVFIDTDSPSGWGLLEHGGQVTGVLLLRGAM